MPDLPVGHALVASAQDLIRIASERLARQLGLSAADAEDISQELFALLWARARLYDPARGAPATFARCVVEAGVRTWLRDRRRLKRGPGETVSLERVAGAAESPPEAYAVTGADAARRTGVSAADEKSGIDLAEDLKVVRARLPAKVRRIFDRLKNHEPAKVARQLGLSRRQVANAIAVIRQELRRAGIGDSEESGHRAGGRRK